ncbi:MAG: flavin reductase family protein [Polyangia bacterium]|jgi:flavin reductase (DIM6/NTAB) family NADH-FMN oxidoreductase RutF|nr:flavin reductase family protein [Polyangia bacterium]
MTAKRSLGAKIPAMATPTWLVCTYDAQDRPNAMTVAWGGVCCSGPPSLQVSLRSTTHTHGSLMARKAFTVCVPSADHLAQADYLGMVSGRDQDKLAAAGLTPLPFPGLDAPYLSELPLVFGCRLTHHLEVGLHTLFVGEILDVLGDETILDGGGKVDLASLGAVIYAPDQRAYHGVGPRLAEAFEVGKSLKRK